MEHPGADTFRKMLLGLVLIGILMMAVVGWILAESRQAAWRYAAGTSSNLVTALERDIERTFETYDLSLRATIRALDAPALSQIDATSRQQLLFDGSIEARNMGAIVVMDAKGAVIHESGTSTPADELVSDRDYFRVHRDNLVTGLYISQPYHSGSTGEWSVALSRRVSGPSGEFAGIVVGSIGYSYFSRLFSKLDLGPGSTITLFKMDGTLMYRSPIEDAEIGIQTTEVTVLQHVRNGEFAPYDGVSRVHGEPRLFAFARVGDLPLALSVNTALGTVYSAWFVRATLSGSIFAVLLLVAIWLLRGIRTQQRRRERAEQEMLHSNSLLRAYFDNASDALFIVNVGIDGSLRYETLNRSCEALTGVSAEAARGKRSADFFEPAIASAIETRYRHCLSSGEPYSYRETRALPNGQCELHVVLVPIRAPSGRITLILGSSRDMTDQTRLQSEQHHASKMEAVGRLTAGVAHDFNNYLQTIISSLDIMAAEYLDGPEAQEVGQIAHNAASSGAKLIHHLLAFSRQQVLQPRRLNVTNLLGETRKLIGLSSLGAAIRFKIAVEPFTDDIQVDPTQAESCLINLLLNARDAMPDGGSLVLHARNAGPKDGVFGSVGAGKHVIIAVHDTGHGMDEQTMARAFEPFFTTKTFGKGSGLGLSMAQGFCRQSGGDIRILKGGAVGTRVELWLPAATANILITDERECNLATIGRGTGRVLLVEDERDVSIALAAVLVGGGFEVVTVNTAKDGLMRLHDRDPYDAIVTDYSLPDMVGTAFMAHAESIVPGLPMLMLSGFELGDVPVPQTARPIKMLQKPVRRSALLNAVRESIGESRSSIAA